MSLIGKIEPLRVNVPLTIRLELQRTDIADQAAQRPEVRRVDARTIERVVDDVRLLLDI
jgi:D-aminopeptidase